MDFLLSVLTGGATGILGSLLSTGVGFLQMWQEEKKADGEHKRTMEMHRLQSELRAEELENERAIVEEEQSGRIRTASYSHDQSVGPSYRWVAAILRLVRPVLTVGLIGIVAAIYFSTNDFAQRETIIQSVLYMASSAVLWWFGDRATKRK